jgi:hypothetical protein
VIRAYSCYGLRLHADDQIPGLLADSWTPRPDVIVSFSGMPHVSRESRALWYESRRVGRDGRITLSIWRTTPAGAFQFAYHDGTQFLIDVTGTRVWCSRPPASTREDAAVYLRGPVLGLVLRLRGVLCLHASAIATRCGAIAILGDAGAGKSTTAAGCLKLGCALLADDLAALDEDCNQFRAQAGYPRLNLWPDTGEALYGDVQTLPRVAPLGGLDDSWDKRYVDLRPGREFQPAAKPLAAIYLLGERSAEVSAPRIEAMSAPDAFVALINQTYANYALDAPMRAGEFQALGRLVRALPVRKVTPHADPARLMDMCRAILDDCACVSPAGSDVSA